MNNLLQPDIDHLIEYAVHDIDGTLGDAAAKETGWKLFHLMEAITPAPDTSDYRSIWICVERGPIDRWKTFDTWRREEEEYHGGSPLGKTAWKSDWKAWYPHEKRWHLVSCTRKRGWLNISIDHECVLSIVPGHVLRHPDKQRARELDTLARAVARAATFLRNGTYQRRLKAELPYSCRWGFLRRSTFWRITGIDGRRYGGDLPQEQREQLACILRKQLPERQLPLLPELSAGEYFSALREAYKAAGFRMDGACGGYAASDPRAWYCYLGDPRDTDVLELDQDSPGVFRDFVQSNHRFSHAFEVLAGRSATRVYLEPILDTEGLWHLRMSRFFNANASEMALMWEKLNELGMPTYLCDAGNLASLLLGEDWVLLAPDNEEIDYLEDQTRFGRRVGLALHLWNEYHDALVAAADWMPIDIPLHSER